ncbi:histone-like nucleoid-structuring protein, MvaT/MvaU family [Vreelandella nanhaiensis]|uniref:MvaT DNA-binding domain-containing protein n=1 Tax=Vreelandella nanhaiensis TaxID=1258546 RepID=A0A433KZ02_9GAMM|nr:histone-like nucleoid-structuring protein, MvaT/MvaU family [Halomonas nanhaiensis]RUR34881.1 hypothetical protein ELY38_00035 [Halomonas nanhaiensis]
MPILREYQQLQEQSKSLREQLISFENREDFKRESAFFNRLKMLMADYNESALDVIKLVNTEKSVSESPAIRKKRMIKVYRNPYEREIVETRGGNHKTLRAWKDQYGAEVVDSWLVEEK